MLVSNQAIECMNELKDLLKRLLEFRKDRDWEQFHKPKAGQRRIDLVQLKKLAQIYKKNLDFFIE